jgi:hypothetical protein
MHVVVIWHRWLFFAMSDNAFTVPFRFVAIGSCEECALLTSRIITASVIILSHRERQS